MTIDIERTQERSTRYAERIVKDFGRAAGVEGRTIRSHHLAALTEHIARVRKKRPTRKSGKSSWTPEVWLLLAGVPDAEIAEAVLTGVLNATATERKDDDQTAAWSDNDDWDDGIAQDAKRVIGHEIEWQVHGFHLNEENTLLAQKVERAAAYKGNMKARRAVHRKEMRGAGLEPEAWTPGERLRVGNWGFDCCLRALDGIIVEGRFGEPQIAVAEWATAVELAKDRLLDHPVFAPSLKRPKPWTSFYNEDRQPFLRHCRDVPEAKRAVAGGQMRKHMDAVSYLQSTPWRINEPVLDFVQELGGWGRQSFVHPPISIRGPSLPQVRLVDGKWIREKPNKVVIPLLQKIRRKGERHVFDWDLAQAERLRLRGRAFYTEMYCDFRGRVYPFPHLNYGRGDYVRALFRFAHGAPIGERGIYWLKVATANTYNEGKNTDSAVTRLLFEERAKWTEDNLDKIRALVADPMSGLLHGELDGWLEDADDPFQFLAHAIELTKALKAHAAGQEFFTTLPIAFDASNSGAQHYALLIRDPDGARLTNLVCDDPDAVEDLYEEVLGAIERRFNVVMDEAKTGISNEECRWVMWLRSREMLKRKFIKGLVVAFLYGQQEAGTLKEILKELKLKKDDLPEGIDYFLALVRKSMKNALPGAVEVMDFARKTARPLARKGKAFRSVSPTGVPVCTLEHKPDTKKTQMWLGFRETPRRHRAVLGDLDAIDVAACVRGAPANLVHSMDAGHIALVALACEAEGIPLACVHDSFGTLACHVDAMRDILMRELRTMYENDNPLQEIYDHARSVLGPKVKLPPVPQPRSLHLAWVTGPYAFS